MKTLKHLIAPLFTLLLTACGNLQALGEQQLQGLREPRISVKGVKLGPSRLAEQKFLVDLAIENPNAQGISANEIALALAINGKGIARGINTKPLDIKANGTSQVEVAVVANTLELLQQGLLLGNAQQKTLPYQITGHIGLLGGLLQGLKFPISYSGQLDANDLMKRFSPGN